MADRPVPPKVRMDLHFTCPTCGITAKSSRFISSRELFSIRDPDIVTRHFFEAAWNVAMEGFMGHKCPGPPQEKE